jgi:hypothetical protein
LISNLDQLDSQNGKIVSVTGEECSGFDNNNSKYQGGVEQKVEGVS